MDRRHDIVSSGVAEIVLRKVVSPQWREIAEFTGVASGLRQPEMAPKVEVPERVMRVDDRTVIEFRHGTRSLTHDARASTSALPLARRHASRKRKRWTAWGATVADIRQATVMLRSGIRASLSPMKSAGWAALVAWLRAECPGYGHREGARRSSRAFNSPASMSESARSGAIGVLAWGAISTPAARA